MAVKEVTRTPAKPKAEKAKLKAEKTKPKAEKAKPKAEKTKPKAIKSDEKQVKIRLVRSLIGRPRKQREVIKGLGLRRIDSEVIRKDCPEIRGMIRKVPHLVKVKELDTK